jgi:hypothetical protein
MKNCTCCGKEYPDDLEACPIDGHALRRVGGPEFQDEAKAEVAPLDAVSPEEKTFWERMTFRQVAILFIRIQAIGFLFNAAIDLTYLPRYLDFWSYRSSYSEMSGRAKLDLLLLVLRILMNVAVAFALIQHSDKILRWFLKDLVPAPAANRSDAKTGQPPVHSA